MAERVRADAERDRAAALAERNRLGREIHDVLAHSLGALSVQLDAAHAVLETSKDQDKARRLVEKARRLAVEGLEETRRAVHALRDEPVDLAEQLAALAAREGAVLTVVGQPRTLSTDAGLAVYRAAQEALTNARKHAPGAEVSICLDFSPAATVLVVNNSATDPRSTAELAATGGGFGLRGMRERIEVVGGCVQAEPGNVRLDRRDRGPGMRVVVADDQTAVREGLVTLLETMPGFDVVGAAANGDDAIALVDGTAPDVVLMDLRMPGVDGIEATRRYPPLTRRPRWSYSPPTPTTTRSSGPCEQVRSAI